MGLVDDAITEYQQALDKLDPSREGDFAAKVLTVLLAREKVALVLGDKNNPSDPAAIKKLEKNDSRLAGSAVRIDSKVGGEALKSWRRSVSPDKNSWWWSIDDLAVAKHIKANRVWTLIAIVLLTIAFGIATETFNLFRGVGANPLSKAGNIVQVVLALIAAGAFTPGGSKWLVDFFSSLGIRNRRFQGAARPLLAVVVLGLTIGIRFYLPGLVADHFIREGDQLLPQEPHRAVLEYQQAVSLEPDSREAHTALAKAIEKTHDYTKAREEYARTVSLYDLDSKHRFDDSYYLAKSKVVRYKILLDKDYDAALTLLRDLQKSINNGLVPNPTLLQRLVFTNLGWVDFERKHFDQARGELVAATRSKDLDSAEAHYFLALTYEALNHQTEADQQWTAAAIVLQHDENQADEMPPEWKGRVEEKLAAKASRSVSTLPPPSPLPSPSP